jgi:hypothetical protein
MITELIKLRWRETVRSAAWSRNLVIRIVYAGMMLYLMAAFLMLGFTLDKVLLQIAGGGNPVELLNRVLLYYFGFEVIVRFFMQATPAMSITPFLHLPVRRSMLMHFLLARSAVGPLNYISFLVFIPFAVRSVSAVYSGMAACCWLVALFLTVVTVIYATVYVKRQLVVKPVVTLCCGVAFLGLIALDVLKVFSLSEFSVMLFGAALVQPVWLPVFLLVAMAVYHLNYSFLISHSYPEEIDRTRRKKQKTGRSLAFMSRFGRIGELVGLELKLIFRHKRTKSIIYTAAIFLTYGLLFYPNPQFRDSMLWLVFVGIFVTGLPMISYGQYIIAWEGRFFDGILIRNNSLLEYLQAKYYLLAAFCLVCYVLTVPYVFFGMKFLWLQTACFLFNTGVGSVMMLWFGTYNSKRIELMHGSAFNWQGSGVMQFIVLLPLLVLPMLIVFIFDRFGLGAWGLRVLALLGLAGILSHKQLLQAVCRRLSKAKYSLAEGYRGN